ncbi:MAG: hypothetical protein QM820_65630 [Minicystis sp.]
MSDLGPEARAVLDGGRDGDDPTTADRARVRASVLRAIAAGGAISAATSSEGTAAAATSGEAAAVAPAAGATKAAGSLALGWKVMVALAVIGALGTGLLVTRDRDHAAPNPPAAVAPPPPAALPPSSTIAAPPAADPSPPPAAVAPPPAADPSPPAAVAPPLSVPAPRSSVDPARPLSSPKPPAIAAAPPSADPSPPSAASPPPAANPPRPPPDTLVAETQRLREAHGALQGGDPTRALALLDEQAAAGAQLREERAAARILALCQLGKVDEARAAAARFLAESPRSPLADRVRASCAGR